MNACDGDSGELSLNSGYDRPSCDNRSNSRSRLLRNDEDEEDEDDEEEEGEESDDADCVCDLLNEPDADEIPLPLVFASFS